MARLIKTCRWSRRSCTTLLANGHFLLCLLDLSLTAQKSGDRMTQP